MHTNSTYEVSVDIINYEENNEKKYKNEFFIIFYDDKLLIKLFVAYLTL